MPRSRKPSAPKPTNGSNQSQPASDTHRIKRRLIHRCLEQDPVDVENLRRLASSSGGLLSDDMRRKAWPKLVGASVYMLPELPTEDDMHSHRDYRQVQLDVQRCYKRFPPETRRSHCHRVQKDLSDLVMACLCLSPQSYYYQGFHDIAILWLITVGSDAALAILLKVAKAHLSDFMASDMQRTTVLQTLIYDILQREDTELHRFLLRSEVGTVFCLSWNITWFCHVWERTADVNRLHDFFLASHPFMPLYLSTAIILHRREAVLATECELSAVHRILGRMPQNLPVEQLVTSALLLYQRCPPSSFDSKRVNQCQSFTEYSSFQSGLWHQTSDIQLSKEAVRRYEQHQRWADGTADYPSLGMVPPSKSGPVAAAIVDRSQPPATLLRRQATQIAVVGISTAVGIASALLYTIGADLLF